MVEPDYYAKNGLSPLQAFKEGLLSKEEYVRFCKGNVIKYTIRAGEKTDDPLLDIVKAMDYLHHLHRALKTEPEDSLDTQLEDVKNKISEFKKDYNININNSNLGYVPNTHLRPKKERKREFPKVRVTGNKGLWRRFADYIKNI